MSPRLGSIRETEAMKDVRERAKRERQFERRTEPQRCTCGRWFTRGVAGGFCSAACAAKAEAEKKEGRQA